MRPSGSLTLASVETQLRNGGPLDLSSCGFVDAYGLVAIACAAEVASWKGQETYEPPADEDVARYLERMHVPTVVERVSGMVPSRRLRVNERPRSDVLAEVELVSSWEDAGRVGGLVLDRVSGSEDLRQAIYQCISEACSNVTDHSGTTGYAAAQVYEQGSSSERIVLAIGDTGSGIASNLGMGDDRSAICRVLAGGVTSSGDPQRGYGILNMSEAVRALHGHMVVRSCAGQVRVHSSGQTGSSGAFMQGTIVGVSLPCS